MTYLIDNELKLRVRFIVDHHFLEKYLETPPEERDESKLHKIIILAAKLKELDYPHILFAGERVLKRAEELIDEKSGFIVVKKQLLRFLINPEPDGETSNLLLSIWKTASKIGFKNYLITTSKELKRIFEEKRCTFEIKIPEDASHLIESLAGKSHLNI